MIIRNKDFSKNLAAFDNCPTFKSFRCFMLAAYILVNSEMCILNLN